MLKAKFICMSAEPSGADELLRFEPVIEPDANAQWASNRPAGVLRMTISNEAAQGIFEPGREYVLQFEDAAEHDRREAARAAEIEAERLAELEAEALAEPEPQPEPEPEPEPEPQPEPEPEPEPEPQPEERERP